MRVMFNRAGNRTVTRAGLAPALVGCMLLISSLSPWLADPLGGNLSAWRLPVNIGWQFPAALDIVLNYGLLCLCCAVGCFVVAWRERRGTNKRTTKLIQVVCLLPVALFILQYLCIDMQAINRLAQHQFQWLLISRHFGYSVTPLRIAVKPFDVDAASIQGRLTLLAQQISFGAVLPCVGALVMSLRKARMGADEASNVEVGRAAGMAARGADAIYRVPTWRRYFMLVGGVLVVLLLSRAPLAMLCEHEASNLLAEGSYSGALSWLDVAAFLNPSLEQVAHYHIERGQALYFQYDDENSADSRAYLAFTYRQQNNDLSAYQQLYAAWRTHPDMPWIRDELTITLAKLTEYVHPLNGSPLLRPIDDDSTLPWLELLVEVNPASVYGHYIVGRIQYDLHNYKVSIMQMNIITDISSNSDILSSANTYLALSAGGQQRFIDERNLLYKALEFDTNYRNNTARETLSGLH